MTHNQENMRFYAEGRLLAGYRKCPEKEGSDGNQIKVMVWT